MKDKLLLIWKHLKPENLQKMWLQSKWIWQYGKRYWKSMVVYTLLGIAGSGVSLVSSFISKDLIDIITGHQTGKLLSTFAAMIGFSIANILFSQASTYASTFINLKVDSEIKNDQVRYPVEDAAGNIRSIGAPAGDQITGVIVGQGLPVGNQHFCENVIFDL